MLGDKDSYCLAFSLAGGCRTLLHTDLLSNSQGKMKSAGREEDYNQIRAGPRIGLMPWKRDDGFYYTAAGFVQSLDNDTLAFYHRVEAGSKLNPSSVLQVKAHFVSTPVHQSWRRPGVVYRDLQHGGDGPVNHYPADMVDVAKFKTCCTSEYFANCTSCPLASPATHNQLIAIPIRYFPSLQDADTQAHTMFSDYQYKLWRDAWENGDAIAGTV